MVLGGRGWGRGLVLAAGGLWKEGMGVLDTSLSLIGSEKSNIGFSPLYSIYFQGA